MKTLFNRQTEKNNTRFIFQQSRPGGRETQNYELESVKIEITEKRLDDVVNTIGNMFDQFSDEQKEELKNKIQALMESSDPKEYENLNIQTQEMLNNFLRDNGISGKEVSFSLTRTQETTFVPGSEEEVFSLQLEEIDPFPDGNDPLQDVLGEFNSDGKTKPYVDPEKGLVINGVVQEGWPQGGLQQLLKEDIGGYRVNIESVDNGEILSEEKTLRDVVVSGEYLLTAIQESYPKSETTRDQASLIAGVMRGEVALEGDGQNSVLGLQEAMASIDKSWADSVNWIDNKYGERTRRTFRKFGLALTNMVQQHVIQKTETKENLSLTVKSMTELDEAGKAIIFTDSSGSINKTDRQVMTESIFQKIKDNPDIDIDFQNIEGGNYEKGFKSMADEIPQVFDKNAPGNKIIMYSDELQQTNGLNKFIRTCKEYNVKVYFYFISPEPGKKGKMKRLELTNLSKDELKKYTKKRKMETSREDLISYRDAPGSEIDMGTPSALSGNESIKFFRGIDRFEDYAKDWESLAEKEKPTYIARALVVLKSLQASLVDTEVKASLLQKFAPFIAKIHNYESSNKYTQNRVKNIGSIYASLIPSRESFESDYIASPTKVTD